MKRLIVFLTGAASTLGVSAVVPSGPVDDTVIQGVHGIVSILGGIISTLLIEYIKRKWGAKGEKRPSKK